MSGTTFPQPQGESFDQDYVPGSISPAQQPSNSYTPSWKDQQPQQPQVPQGSPQGNVQGAWQNRQSTPPSNSGYNRNGSSSGGGGSGQWQNRNQGNTWNKPKQDAGDLTLYKPYAVTGNTDFSAEVTARLITIVKRLEALDYTARTGGMDGFEQVVEDNVTKIEVHLPWRDFNSKKSTLNYNSDRAMAVAKQFHPTFDTMSKGVQAFLCKNARIVMGDKMNSPALFLLCWTEDGVDSVRNKTARTGFTGHPISIASALGIPIFNLGKPDIEQRINFYLESLVNVENESNQPSN